MMLDIIRQWANEATEQHEIRRYRGQVFRIWKETCTDGNTYFVVMTAEHAYVWQHMPDGTLQRKVVC